jgi:hypothetical protein
MGRRLRSEDVASTGGSGGLAWKLRRLRTMSVAEVASRVSSAVRHRLEAFGIGRISPRPPRVGAATVRWLPLTPGTVDENEIVRRAQSVLLGNFDVFALRETPLGFPPEWNRDPKSGVLAPMQFGKLLNYRDPSLVGDIKYLWEPSRHLELVTLAQAFVVSREPRYAQGVQVLLESWFDQCPYPLGVHWASSLEHAVRLLNWSVAWQLLEYAGWLTLPEHSAFRQRWLDGVFRHQAFIAGHLSGHSSANNHLLGEYTGLFVATITWPLWSNSNAWHKMSRAGLEREALLQIDEDGVNREQAVWYHHEVADMLLLAGLAARATGIDFPTRYWQRFESMLAYIASLMSVSGRLPMIGDSDDAVMVRFSGAAEFDVYRSLLATGSVLFRRSDFAAKAGAFDDKSRWLLGASAEVEFDRQRALAMTGDPNSSYARRAFEQSGYWVFGDRLDEADEVRIIADAGPLGYLSIAAHGHADALSFTLSCCGRELLIDPGTFAYHTVPQWRGYFKGTSAHNTLRIDGLDQSVSGGSFLWLRHAGARLLEASSDGRRAVWTAVHDGYTRLADPVSHMRTIEFDKVARQIHVTDQLECLKTHEVEMFWHFAEDCEVRLVGEELSVINGPMSMHVHLPRKAGRCELVQGQEAPPLGWVSRRFDEKLPTFTAVWWGRIEGPATLTTVFRLTSSPAE